MGIKDSRLRALIGVLRVVTFCALQMRPQHHSTRIKDAGMAIRHSRGYTSSILQGPEMVWRRGHTVPQTMEIATTRQICIPKLHSTREIRYQGGAKPLGRVPSSETSRESAKE